MQHPATRIYTTSSGCHPTQSNSSPHYDCYWWQPGTQRYLTLIRDQAGTGYEELEWTHALLRPKGRKSRACCVTDLWADNGTYLPSDVSRGMKVIKVCECMRLKIWAIRLSLRQLLILKLLWYPDYFHYLYTYADGIISVNTSPILRVTIGTAQKILAHKSILS